MKKLLLPFVAVLSLTTFGCSEGSSDTGATPPNNSSSVSPTLIQPSSPLISTSIPKNLGSLYQANDFNRYTSVTAPNGKPIHIVAQSKISDEQILKARNVLLHYLTDYKGSQFGGNKTAVANKMADNGALLTLLNGKDGSNPIGEKVQGQPLYEQEIQVEGGTWYMTQNYQFRDASYEEILHLVHDTGIGVDGKNTMPGALPAYQQQIRAAQKNGSAQRLWGIGSADWLKELAKENSLSQEYLAGVVDSYYGLWGAYTQSATHGMWGMYVAKTREDMKTKDPMGYALMDNKFFHPYITYNAAISAQLHGNFSLKFDANKPYTHHAQYLKDVTLLGTNNNSVTVNQLDNNIMGNSGSNMVIFTGNKAEYIVNTVDGVTTVKDTQENRDGTNTLSKVEQLQFADATINI